MFFYIFSLLVHCVEFGLEVLKWINVDIKTYLWKTACGFWKGTEKFVLEEIFLSPAWCPSPCVNKQSACHFSSFLCVETAFLGNPSPVLSWFLASMCKTERKDVYLLSVLPCHSPVMSEMPSVYIIHGKRNVNWVENVTSLLKCILWFFGFGWITKL